MDNLQWRSKARIVAYVDLVLSILGLIGITILVFSSTVFTAEVAIQGTKGRTSEADDHRSALAGLLVFLWITIALCTVITCIDLWAAVMLLKATKPDTDPKVALHRAKIWRNVSVVFLVMGITVNILADEYIRLVFDTVVRGIIIYIVCKFIDELKVAVFGSYPNPSSVVVNNAK